MVTILAAWLPNARTSMRWDPPTITTQRSHAVCTTLTKSKQLKSIEKHSRVIEIAFNLSIVNASACAVQKCTHTNASARPESGHTQCARQFVVIHRATTFARACALHMRTNQQAPARLFYRKSVSLTLCTNRGARSCRHVAATHTHTHSATLRDASECMRRPRNSLNKRLTYKCVL